MYVINNLDFSISQLTEEEALEMLSLAENIRIKGIVDSNHLIWKKWFNSSNLNESQGLLVYSTVFPKRMLLAVAKFFAKEKYNEFN